MDESASRGGLIFSGSRVLAGQAQDYRDPVGAVLYQLQVLLTEYVAAGGDLNQVGMSTSLERTPGRVSRPHLRVDLRGWGRSADGSTAPGASGTSSTTTTS